MGDSTLQPDHPDLRREQVCAMIPVVRHWLAIVTELLCQGDGEVHGTGMTRDDERAYAEFAASNTGHGTETSDVPAMRHLNRLPIEALPTNADERQRLRSLFEQYEACHEALTALQWSVVCLRFRDGLTEAHIASRLGKSRSGVHGVLKRARLRKEAFQRRLRSERFEFARKHLNS